jgi:hypothetical protein
MIKCQHQRIFLLRGRKNQVSQERLRKIAVSIDKEWLSTLLKSQQTYEAKTAKDFATLQKAQNKMLRTLCKVRIKDKISIESMLRKQHMLSINQ